MNEWEEGRIEVSVVNAANLPRLHVGSMHAIQVVDRETCTAVVLPGASQDEAERLLRMIVDGNPGGEMTSQNPTTDDTVTSQNGHCEHCWTGCPRDEDTDPWHEGQSPFSGPFDALWPDGHCPMCAAAKAERERIVAWLRGAAIYDAADFIARGAHLEDQ